MYQLMFGSAGSNHRCRPGHLSPVRRRRILWAAAPSAGSSTAPIDAEREDQAKELLEKTAAYLEDDGQIAPFLGVFDDGSETSPVAGRSGRRNAGFLCDRRPLPAAAGRRNSG